ncbi:DUF6064 family protein [Fodinibius sp. SL11]|uniref:DUF6064 family protein n=1 Tax=Fodinibius sp. SL11 TaxID=3425690 RepID=UPI003F8840AE
MGELPFTIDQFLQVFSTYNQAIWPVQLFAYLLGVASLYLIAKQKETTDIWVNLILGAFWLWMGGVYHITFFSDINTAAYLFGSLFLLQGVGFLILNGSKVKFTYVFRSDIYGIVGTVFIIYGMLIYPLLGYGMGHIYPQSPVFGVAPCPTTIFTFGLILHTNGKVSTWLLIIPGLWSLIGFSAAFRLTIYEDMGLVVAGILGVALLVYRNYKQGGRPVYSPKIRKKGMST